MKKLLGVILCCGLLLTGCGSNSSEDSTKSDKVELTAGGSTSIQPLMEKIAEQFNKDGKGTITVQGGGSSVGTKGAIDGTFEIGMASRELKDDEASKLDGTVIALDGIVVIVNKDNAVKNITLDDIKKVYTGEITNWKDLGGDDAEIAVVAREEGSGTRDGFEGIVGFESDAQIKSAEIQNATGAVVSSVDGNKNAIGYISLGSLTKSEKALTVDGVAASEDTILDGSYKLQRPFTLAVKKDSKKAETLFEYIFSDAGKKIIQDNKYIPVDRK